MVESLIVLLVAGLAMMPLLFSDGHKVAGADAPPAIVVAETKADVVSKRPRVIHEMPHMAAGLVLTDFEPTTDRVAIHLEKWDTDFFWEQPPDGGIELGYETSDGLARIQFANLDEIPAENIDIFVEDESTGTSEHIVLSDAMEAIEAEQDSVSAMSPDAEVLFEDDTGIETELVPGQLVDLGVVETGERVRIELFRHGDAAQADLQIVTQDGLQLLIVNGEAMAFADATTTITTDQIDLVFTSQMS